MTSIEQNIVISESNKNRSLSNEQIHMANFIFDCTRNTIIKNRWGRNGKMVFQEDCKKDLRIAFLEGIIFAGNISESEMNGVFDKTINEAKIELERIKNTQNEN